MQALIPDVATLCDLAILAARGGDTRVGLPLATASTEKFCRPVGGHGHLALKPKEF